MNVNHEDDESEDDFSQLAHRDTMQGQGQKSIVTKSEPVQISRVLPPPSRKPTSADLGMVDYLSGDVYKTVRFSGASGSIHTAVLDNSNNCNPVRPPSLMLSSTPPDDFINPTASMFAPKPAHEEPAPTSKSAGQLPPAPLHLLGTTKDSNFLRNSMIMVVALLIRVAVRVLMMA